MVWAMYGFFALLMDFFVVFERVKDKVKDLKGYIQGVPKTCRLRHRLVRPSNSSPIGELKLELNNSHLANGLVLGFQGTLSTCQNRISMHEQIWEDDISW